MRRTTAIRFEERARHAARAEHAHRDAILARQQARADARRRADAHVLQMAVVHDGERLAIAAAVQKHQPAERARAARSTCFPTCCHQPPAGQCTMSDFRRTA